MLERTKDISQIRNALRYDKKNSGYVYAKLLFTKEPDDTDWRAAEKAINELCARLPIKFLVEENVRNVLNQRKNKRYEQTKKHYKNIEMRPDLWDLGAEANAAYKTVERVNAAEKKTTVTV
jgi:site-specific DNA-cytosine methylase